MSWAEGDNVNPEWLVFAGSSHLRFPQKPTCKKKVSLDKLRCLKRKGTHRSGCPVSVALEIFGDSWSLLIIRDLMVRGYHSFKQFQESGEGIATNVLTDRLRKLQAAGIIHTEADETDRRRVHYRLTEKGINLAPVLLEVLIWGARHEKTGTNCAVVEAMAEQRERILAEVRRRWRERDPRPLLTSSGTWQLQ